MVETGTASSNKPLPSGLPVITTSAGGPEERTAWAAACDMATASMVAASGG